MSNIASIKTTPPPPPKKIKIKNKTTPPHPKAGSFTVTKFVQIITLQVDHFKFTVTKSKSSALPGI